MDTCREIAVAWTPVTNPVIPMKSLLGLTAAELKKRTCSNKGGCWLWCGNRNTNGYPRITRAGVNYFVHRVMYRLGKGPIPRGKSLWHDCRHPHCINPAHLRPLTRREIVAAMLAQGRFCIGSSHPSSKLTETVVRRVRRLHDQGKRSYRQLAEEYGVDQSLIIRVVLRKKWLHVT